MAHCSAYDKKLILNGHDVLTKYGKNDQTIFAGKCQTVITSSAIVKSLIPM